MPVTITASMVNELRQKTGAGMMDCKNALKETDGDMEKAIDELRKKGAAVAAKRADRTASEGTVLIMVNETKSFATILEVNSETDFVANSDDFKNFAQAALKKAYAAKAVSVEDLIAKNPEISEELTTLTGKVGEKTQVSRVNSVSAEGGFIADYIHPGNKIGTLVVYSNVSSPAGDEFVKLARDIAIQVAAMKPVAVDRKAVPSDLVSKEIEIYKEIARNEGKPENVIERIATGKLDKYYQEVCLLEQTFFKDQSNARTIAQLVDEYNKTHNSQVAVQNFVLYQLGSGK